MDPLRKYIWLLVIFGMLFVSLVIGFIFFLINKCISRAGKHRIAQLERGNLFKIESNKYQERNLGTTIPPLPPRTQFLTAEAQSYENLAEAPDHGQKIDDYEQGTDYYQHNIDDYEEAMPEYEEAGDGLPDYIKVEDDEKVLPTLPTNKNHDPAEDSISTEDYDDIGEENENAGEEDYDDVG